MRAFRIAGFLALIFLLLSQSSCSGNTEILSETNPTVSNTHTVEPTEPISLPIAPTDIPKCSTYQVPEAVLSIDNNKGRAAEPTLLTGDFNSDGFDDVLLTWSIWGDLETFKFELLLNDQNGNLFLGTSELLSGEIPELQSLPAIPIIVDDLNADGLNDIFLGVAGLDTEPFPGFQNLLLLSNTEGKLQDASSNLPQMKDFPHSVSSADVDNDGDIDIYVGNMWAGPMINPQLLINDGNGAFKAASGNLPPQLALQQNGFSASEFVDINNDGFPDLVLGDAGDDISNEYSSGVSLVLLNNGEGRFRVLEGALPPKLSPTWLALDVASADLTSDGYQDLIVAYSDSSFVGRFFQVLINNQDGTFAEETDQRLPNSTNETGDYIFIIDLIDLDNDGDSDLVARNWDDQDPDPFIFMNDSDGFFVQEDLGISLNTVFYTILDMEGDGGSDFITATHGVTAHINLFRQMGCE